jgi:hypothetical protein
MAVMLDSQTTGVKAKQSDVADADEQPARRMSRMVETHAAAEARAVAEHSAHGPKPWRRAKRPSTTGYPGGRDPMYWPDPAIERAASAKSHAS